jgi:GT2 family glycosyltransferase/tetratricopeptide (TPR) repeat protein
MNPKVSIVIPVYNGLRYTLECLESLKKTQHVPFEIIVCGVGNDGTIAMMMEWEMLYNNIRFIHNSTDDTTFGANVNLGAFHAVGEYICILNNDTIVTSNWLAQMLTCFETLSKSPERPAPPPAIVAPASNYVMSHQMVQLPQGFHVDFLEQFAERNATENRGKWIYSAIVSGFCMLIKKSVWDQLGGFNTVLRNGNEDVEFCCRVNEAGYSCWVDKSAFVFHHGSKSLDPDADQGTYNRVECVKLVNGAEPVEQRISLNTRIKCTQEELKLWMDRHYAMFDIVNVVDDDSGWDIESWLKANYPNSTYTNMPGEIEVVQRNKVYELSLAQGMQWMVTLDHDEFFEEKIDRAYLQRLVNTPIPGCYSFIGRWIHLWNSPTTYHVTYPPSNGIFMIKVLPNLSHFAGSPVTSLHCSRMPNVPAVSTAPVNVHIIHYGYIDPAQREAKRQYYEAKDTNLVEELVGGSDYSHLTDQTHIVLSEWFGSNKYTISLNAMAESEPLHKVQMFLESIGTIVDEIIFRVGPNREDLKWLIERWGGKAYERVWNDDYSDMRNFLINKSTGAYILVMDMDEQFTKPPELPNTLESQPTAIMFNVNNLQRGRPDVFTEVMRMFQNRPDIRFSGIIHETIEDAISKIKSKSIIRAKGVINHFGFLTPKLPDKLKKYVKLNKKAMHRDPKDPKPYFNLALHYIEDGEIKEGLKHLEKAIALHPKFTLAKIELAKLYLRFARALFASSASDVPEGHPLHKPVNELEGYLKRLVPDQNLTFPPLDK